MDRNLIMKSEAALLIISSLNFAMMKPLLNIILPQTESYYFCFLIILILFFVEYLVVDKFNNQEENNQADVDQVEEIEYETILLFRLFVDLGFFLVFFLVCVLIDMYWTPELYELDFNRPPSYLDKILSRPTPEEKAEKLLQEYYVKNGLIFRIISGLNSSFRFNSILRFYIVVIQLAFNTKRNIF